MVKVKKEVPTSRMIILICNILSFLVFTIPIDVPAKVVIYGALSLIFNFICVVFGIDSESILKILNDFQKSDEQKVKDAKAKISDGVWEFLTSFFKTEKGVETGIEETEESKETTVENKA